jgi:putative transposase
METTKIDGDVSAPVTVDEQIARIIEQSQEQGLHLTGEGGLLPDMIRQAVEAALHAEMTGHVGYERHAPQGRGRGTPATA